MAPPSPQGRWHAPPASLRAASCQYASGATRMAAIDVDDRLRREAVQRVAPQIELPAIGAAARVLPVRMDVELDFVAGARERSKVAAHLVRFAARGAVVRRVLGELAEIARVDEE